jgi:putative endonuclease
VNEKTFYVYILASRPNGAIYVGFTSDLIKRVYEHKNKIIEGHTAKYGINKLVYYEMFGDPATGIEREKRLKKWKRAMKNDLIARTNPFWEDLYSQLIR